MGRWGVDVGRTTRTAAPAGHGPVAFKELPQPTAKKENCGGHYQADDQVLHKTSSPREGLPSTPGFIERYRRMTVPWGSDRRNHDIGRCWCIKADGAAVDLDHALLPVSFAQQLEFAAGQEAKIGHPGTSPPVAIDGADSKTAIATRLGKRAPRLHIPVTTVHSRPAS